MFEKLNNILQYTKDKLGDVNIKDYVFVCSSDFKCNRKEYKGHKIYYEDRIKKDTIYFMQSPYAKNYNL